jgi:hypothetical protein
MEVDIYRDRTTFFLSKEKERKKKIVKQAWKWTFEAITL